MRVGKLFLFVTSCICKFYRKLEFWIFYKINGAMLNIISSWFLQVPNLKLLCDNLDLEQEISDQYLESSDLLHKL